MPSAKFLLNRPEKPGGKKSLEVTWNGNVVPVDWDEAQPDDYDFQCPVSQPLVCEDGDPKARIAALRKALWK